MGEGIKIFSKLYLLSLLFEGIKKDANMQHM